LDFVLETKEKEKRREEVIELIEFWFISKEKRNKEKEEDNSGELQL